MGDEFESKKTQMVASKGHGSKGGGLIGRTIAGKYRISQKLARGGMGIVYIAQHLELDRPVVVKVLAHQLMNDEAASSRFRREAKGLSSLSHPNIVQIYDYGQEGDVAYIVMEYVEGETLTQVVKRMGTIPFDILLNVTIQILQALGAAHRNQIVHRDIKPSNIIVGEKNGKRDFTKVLDFGLARLTNNASVDITKGNLVGTVAYLAPEVIVGGKASPQSDIYALGVMLFYLFTGNKPFEAADDMSVMYQHVNQEPPSLAEALPSNHAVPSEMIRFIHLCMEKDPAKRPYDANVALSMLGEFVSFPSFERSGEMTPAPARYTPLRNEVRPGSLTSISEITYDPIVQSHLSALSLIEMERAQTKRLTWVVAAMVAIAVILAAGAFVVSLRDSAKVKQTTIVTPPVVIEQETVEIPKTALRIITTPEAVVKVDGQPVGLTPLVREVDPGTHVLSIEADGYRSHAERVKVVEGTIKKISVRLIPKSEKARKPQRTVEETKTKPIKITRPIKPKKGKVKATPVREPNPIEEPEPEPIVEDPIVEVPTPEPEPKEKPKGGLLPTNSDKDGLLPVGK